MSIDPILLTSIVSAVAAVILVILGLPPFLRWWRGRGQLPGRPALGAIEATGRAVPNVPTDWVPRRRQPPPKPAETVLFDDTLEIEATGFAEVHERLAKGTVVEGIAEEVSGLSFAFYIMDQRNYARFSEDRGGTDIYGQEDRVAFSFKKRIPRDGVWYFVFDAYGKQTDREIRLEIRSIEPP